MAHLKLHFQWNVCNFWLYMYVLLVIQHFKELYVFRAFQVTFNHNCVTHKDAVSTSELKGLQ